MLFAFDFTSQCLVFFSIILALAIICFLIILGIIIVFEIAKSVIKTRRIISRLEKKGIEKELRKKIFKRLRAQQKMISRHSRP